MDRKDIPFANPEKVFPKMMFVTETDGLGRLVKADGAQLRLNKTDQWSTLLTSESPNKNVLALIHPDESDQQENGQAWFIYGDRETNSFHIKSVAGKFHVPSQMMIIDADASRNIFAYSPDRQSDLKVENDKTLQPMALVYKDRITQQFVIARRLFESTDVPTNTVKFNPSNFELTWPHAQETKAAQNIIASWQKQQDQERIRIDLLKAVKENVHLTALRLAHKNSKLPPELKPNVRFNDTNQQYEITLYVSENGKKKIIGKSDTPQSEADMQIGGDFGFGSRLLFNPTSEITNNPDQEITGSIEISQYDADLQKRQKNTLIENVKIQKCSDRKLSIEVANDQVNGNVFEVNFSSESAENIINALIGIERGLKPKYLPINQVFGT